MTITLKGKDADRFVRKMIKKQNSPISKKDKKLARDIEENMSKLQVVESDEEIDDGLCQRCKKNKATINYTDSIMSYTHGFVEHICQECYDKIKHENTWYKEGRKETIREFEEWVDDKWKNPKLTDVFPNILKGMKHKLEEMKKSGVEE